jgi:hypothetical protein
MWVFVCLSFYCLVLFPLRWFSLMMMMDIPCQALRAKSVVFLSYDVYSVLYMFGCDGESWRRNSDSWGQCSSRCWTVSMLVRQCLQFGFRAGSMRCRCPFTGACPVPSWKTRLWSLRFSSLIGSWGSGLACSLKCVLPAFELAHWFSHSVL